MKTKMFLLLAICFLLKTTGNAQIYADTVITAFGVSNPNNAVNGNPNDYATMSTPLGISTTSNLKLGFHPSGAGGMRCQVKVQSVDGLITAGVLQGLTLTVYNSNGKTIATKAGFSLADVELVDSALGIYYIGISTPQTALDIAAAQLSLTGLVTLSYNLRIYHALLFYGCKGIPADKVVDSLNVANAQHAVTPGRKDYALMQPPLIGTSLLGVTFNNTAYSTNRVRFQLGTGDSVAGAQVLSNITLTAYNSMGVTIASKSGFTLADAEVMSNGQFTLGLSIPKNAGAVAKASIGFNGLISVLATLRVYAVVINNQSLPQKPYITPGGIVTFCKGTSVKLTAKPAYASYEVTWQWYRNNEAIAGADSKTYNAKQGGNYVVTATTAGGCTSISEQAKLVAQSCTSTQPSAEKNLLSIYPNPFTNYTTLQPEKVHTGGVLTITDARGNVVQTLKVGSNQPVRLLATYKPGIYFLRLTVPTGEVYSATVSKQ